MSTQLQNFFPYRLAVLADAVSRSMAQVYEVRFDLSRDEWRVLAALAELGSMKTTALIPHTMLDKMQVSRAVTRMEREGLIAREDDPQDGRGYIVSVLPKGKAVYRRIVPMVHARERFLLEGLEENERAAFIGALEKVLERARRLEQQG